MSTFIEHIFIFASHEAYPEKAVELALQLSKGYDKPICFLSYMDKKIKATKSEIEVAQQQWVEKLAPQYDKAVERHVLESKKDFFSFMEDAEASMLIFQLSENAGYNKVSPMLSLSRELRIPYFFVKPYFESVDLQKILVPVTFLVEDREKGRFASNLGKYFDAEPLLMIAKDYGTKAQQNADAICTLLDKFELNYSFIGAEKDSFKVEIEATKRSEEIGAGMVLISASREYGLDDMFFGPKELHCINAANVPLMIINPRADLYVLCG